MLVWGKGLNQPLPPSPALLIFGRTSCCTPPPKKRMTSHLPSPSCEEDSQV